MSSATNEEKIYKKNLYEFKGVLCGASACAVALSKDDAIKHIKDQYKEDMTRPPLDCDWWRYPSEETIERKVNDFAYEISCITPFVSEVEIGPDSYLFLYHKVADYRRQWHVPFAVVANKGEEPVVKMEELFQKNMTLTDPKERLEEFDAYSRIIRNLNFPMSFRKIYYRVVPVLIDDPRFWYR